MSVIPPQGQGSRTEQTTFNREETIKVPLRERGTDATQETTEQPAAAGELVTTLEDTQAVAHGQPAPYTQLHTLAQGAIGSVTTMAQITGRAIARAHDRTALASGAMNVAGAASSIIRLIPDLANIAVLIPQLALPGYNIGAAIGIAQHGAAVLYYGGAGAVQGLVGLVTIARSLGVFNDAEIAQIQEEQTACVRYNIEQAQLILRCTEDNKRNLGILQNKLTENAEAQEKIKEMLNASSNTSNEHLQKTAAEYRQLIADIEAAITLRLEIEKKFTQILALASDTTPQGEAKMPANNIEGAKLVQEQLETLNERNQKIITLIKENELLHNQLHDKQFTIIEAQGAIIRGDRAIQVEQLHVTNQVIQLTEEQRAIIQNLQTNVIPQLEERNDQAELYAGRIIAGSSDQQRLVEKLENQATSLRRVHTSVATACTTAAVAAVVIAGVPVITALGLGAATGAAYVGADAAQQGYGYLRGLIVRPPSNVGPAENLGEHIQYAYQTESTGLVGRFVTGRASTTQGLCFIPIGTRDDGSIQVEHVAFNFEVGRAQAINIDIFRGLCEKIYKQVKSGHLGLNQAIQILNDLKRPILSGPNAGKCLAAASDDFIKQTIEDVQKLKPVADIPLKFQIIPPLEEGWETVESPSASSSSSSASTASERPLNGTMLGDADSRIREFRCLDRVDSINCNITCKGIQPSCTIRIKENICPLTYAYDAASSGWGGYLAGRGSSTNGVLCVPIGVDANGEPVVSVLKFSFQSGTLGLSAEDAKLLTRQVLEQFIKGNLTLQEVRGIVMNLLKNLDDEISKANKRQFISSEGVAELQKLLERLSKPRVKLNTGSAERKGKVVSLSAPTSRNTLAVDVGLNSDGTEIETVRIPLNSDGRLEDAPGIGLLKTIKTQVNEGRLRRESAVLLLKKLLSDENKTVFRPQMIEAINKLIQEYASVSASAPLRPPLSSVNIDLQNAS